MLCSLVIVMQYPLDTVKVHMQLLGSESSKLPARRVLLNIVRKEGCRALYRGVSVPMLTSGVQNAYFFSINQALNEALRPRFTSSSAGGDDSCSGRLSNLGCTAAAGALTGPFSCLMSTPMDLVKVRMQTARVAAAAAAAPVSSTSSATVLPATTVQGCIAEILREGGMRGLYKGYVPMVAMRLVGLPFYFGSYELSKHLLAAANKDDTHDGLLPLWAEPLVGGCCAGFFYWLPAYPIDTLKTRMQSDRSGQTTLRTALRAAWRDTQARHPGDGQGITAMARCAKGLYRGLVPCVGRSMQVNALIWFCVEYADTWMAKNGW
jgi:hypothetical protein